MKRLLSALCIGILVSSFSGCAFLPQEEELPRAPVIAGNQGQAVLQQCTVTRGNIELTVRTRATYAATNEEELRFAEKGLKIDTVYHAVGDEIHKGDLIAELYCDDVRDEIENQSDQVQAAKDAFYRYKWEYNEGLKAQQEELNYLAEAGESESPRYQSLLDAMAKADADFQVQCRFYEEEIHLNEAKLAALKVKLSKRQIVAGMDGTLCYLMPLSEEEDTIYNGTDLVASIADYSSGIFTGTADDASHYKVGEICQMTVNQNVIDVEVKEITEKGKKFLVTFAPVVPSADLHSNDAGEINKVVESRQNVLCLPTACVHITPTVQYVTMIDENGIKSQKSIGIGLKTPSLVEIISGLSEGDVVLK